MARASFAKRSSRRGHFLALLCASFLATGCFSPDDIFQVLGTVEAAGGVEGQRVTLERGTWDDDECRALSAFKETEADRDGGFLFEVFRAQAQRLSGRGTGFCFRVEASYPSGARAEVSPLLVFGPVDLPTLPDWRPDFSLDGETLRFSPVRPYPDEETLGGASVVHRAQVWTDDGGVLWEQDDRQLALTTGAVTRVPLSLPPLALEDFSGKLWLWGRIDPGFPQERELGGPFDAFGGLYTVDVVAGQALPLAGARVPVSRGASCAPLRAPCALTDGDLTPVDLGARQALEVTLASPAVLSAIVLRGVEASDLLVMVQLTTPDGGVVASQHPLPLSLYELDGLFGRDAVGPDGGRALSAPKRAQYVVLTLDAGVEVTKATVRFPQGVERAAEVSLFE